MTQERKTINMTTDIWAKIASDEEGLVTVGQNRQIRLSDLHQAMQQSLGQDSVTGIFGGQFRFKVQVSPTVILAPDAMESHTTNGQIGQHNALTAVR